MFQSMYNIVTVNIVDMYNSSNYIGSDILRNTLCILPEVRSRTLQEERQP